MAKKSKILSSLLSYAGWFTYSLIILGAFLNNILVGMLSVTPLILFSKKFTQSTFFKKHLTFLRPFISNSQFKTFTFIFVALLVIELTPTESSTVSNSNDNLSQQTSVQTANSPTLTDENYRGEHKLHTSEQKEEKKLEIIHDFLNISDLEKNYQIPQGFFNSHEFEKATLLEVIDGDTIRVEIAGKTYKVRYIGIDTPELSQEECYAKEAKKKNQELLDDKPLILLKDVRNTDKYGRLLRYVFTPDTFINAELVKQGYAKILTIPPDVALAEIFSNLQQEAQAAKRGLWNPKACQKKVEKISTTSTHHSQRTNYKRQPSKNQGLNCGGYTCSYDAYNCRDLKTHAQAQYVYECCLRKVGYDVHKLDRDKDGLACESLP